MPPTFNSPKQALEQGVCGQYGWSSRYFRDASSGRWCVEVRWGVGDGKRQTFVSDDTSDESIPGAKKGHAAAAAVALEGLDAIVRSVNLKPLRTVEHALGSRFESTCEVLDGSQPGSWDRLWGCLSRCSPRARAVGIDVEGNLQTPPVLVQVCVQVRKRKRNICVSWSCRVRTRTGTSARTCGACFATRPSRRFFATAPPARTSVRSASTSTSLGTARSSRVSTWSHWRATSPARRAFLEGSPASSIWLGPTRRFAPPKTTKTRRAFGISWTSRTAGARRRKRSRTCPRRFGATPPWTRGSRCPHSRGCEGRGHEKGADCGIERAQSTRRFA